MGCGGSKQKQQAQQDVAAGNAPARRVLLRSSTVVRGRKPAFTLRDDPDASRLSEAAVAGEAEPASSGSSEEEYFSSSREMESPEAGEYLSPGKGADANADMEGSGKVAAAAAAAAEEEREKKEKDEEEIVGAKEDDAYKLAITIDETGEKEIEPTATENKKSTEVNSKEDKTSGERELRASH